MPCRVHPRLELKSLKNSYLSQKGVKSFSRSVKLIEPVQNRYKKEIMQGPFSQSFLILSKVKEGQRNSFRNLVDAPILLLTIHRNFLCFPINKAKPIENRLINLKNRF